VEIDAADIKVGGERGIPLTRQLFIYLNVI